MNHELKVRWPLHFYVPPIAHHYNLNTVNMENAGGKHAQPYHDIASLHFALNWNTKKDRGKFIMHVFYVLWLAKRHALG